METPRTDWLVHEQFRVARVAKLPYAHSPFRCDHAATFKECDGDGRRFYEALTPGQLVSCVYHQLADWRTVATASVQLFRAYRDKFKSELREALYGSTLPDRDLDALYALFADPIVWGGRAPRVTNGQHRICALRASGAALVVIDHNKLDPYAPN